MSGGRYLASTLHIRAIDTVLAVELAGRGAADLTDAVRRAWAGCVVPADGEPDARLRVVLDPDPAAREGADVAGADLDLVLHRLSPAVTTAAIGHQAGRLVMLHAAALAHPATGRTVALVAPSGTGKTTAARALGRTLGYLTDETVAVRADGSVAAYAKPLSVLGDGPGLLKQQMPAGDLGLRAAPDRCRLAALLLLARDGSGGGDGGGQAWLEPVPTVRALGLLAPETSYLARLPRPLHRLAEVVERAGGLRIVHYADREQLVPLVADLLDARQEVAS